MQSYILREKFLEFFRSKKHKIVDSDSLVPKDDPTVLFTPAGMNQFKKEFLGFDSGFKRAATSQRCLRTDDLDKVGKTKGHHTFFEMLGNFSFGDYFKEEAITWAWEFLTQELKISQERLWVSIYKEDDEAYSIWRKVVKLPADRIVRLGDKENYWPSEAKEKGPNGPCGPCSEIFFDQGINVGCKKSDCSPACSCQRFLEVWNLVFTQFNRKEGGLLEPLPHKNIDTGMGLERLAAVMQGAANNFETDLFKPIISEIIYELKHDNPDNHGLICAIADHIRAVTFSIYDGVLPSNEARGYVVRKLIRKCTLHLRTLGVDHAFLHKLVPQVCQIMKHCYPGLAARKEDIAQVILAEEKHFITTLNSSGSLFQEKFHGFTKDQDADKVGRIAFNLYDTYGVPLEITQAWLDKQNIKLSLHAFGLQMEEQKSRSKSLSKMKGDVFDMTDLDLGKIESSFVGYKTVAAQSKILKIVKDGRQVKSITAQDEARIILTSTPFYAEAGGQIGDAGEIKKGKNVFEVADTKRAGKAIVHTGRVSFGTFELDDTVKTIVDNQRRMAIARNHTATHLLQAALRTVLGPHVQQQGSFVAAERFRFDFTHFKDVGKAELDKVESLVNSYVIRNEPLLTKEMTLAQAKKSGALAFFGDRYASKVRVVSIGDLSKEFCGGTHLEATGSIGYFKILQESSVASGVRRIEGTTGSNAYSLVKAQEDILLEASALLNVPKENLSSDIQLKLSRIRALEKQLHSQKLESSYESLDSLIKEAPLVKECKLITKVFEDLDMELLRKSMDAIKKKTSGAIIALGSKIEGRALLVMGLTDDLTQKGLDASQLIRIVAKQIGGSGGGRKDLAQAGGSEPENFQKAFDKLNEIVSSIKL